MFTDSSDTARAATVGLAGTRNESEVLVSESKSSRDSSVTARAAAAAPLARLARLRFSEQNHKFKYQVDSHTVTVGGLWELVPGADLQVPSWPRHRGGTSSVRASLSEGRS